MAVIRGIRVALCYNLRENFPWQPGLPEDAAVEWDILGTVDHLEQGLAEAGHLPLLVGDPGNLMDPSIRNKCDLVFSICEMTGFRFRESLVPSLCEILRLPYAMSAPDALLVALDKNLANFTARQAGIPVPDWTLAGPGVRSPSFSTFPCIVKPSAEGSGMGITHASVAYDPDQLAVCVARVVADYQQPALVQAFMPGREFTVGVVETGSGLASLKVLELVPRVPTPNFLYHVNMKERADELLDFIPLRDEPYLEARLGQIACEAHCAIGCRDASRVDLRLDAMGIPHFLELNPLPHLHPVIGDFCRSARAAGVVYPKLVGGLIDSAARRWGLQP